MGGGPAGVGNAVNETVVFTFMALFAINVVATAVGVQGDDVTSVDGVIRLRRGVGSRRRQLEPGRRADPVLRAHPACPIGDVFVRYPKELVRLIAQMGLGAGALWPSSAEPSPSSAS